MASGYAILNINGPPPEALQNTAHGLHPLSHLSCVIGSMCWFELLIYFEPALFLLLMHYYRCIDIIKLRSESNTDDLTLIAYGGDGDGKGGTGRA